MYFVTSQILMDVNRLFSVCPYQRVSQMEREQLSIPKYTSSSSVFSGVHIAGSLVFCAWCRQSLFIILFYFFWSFYCFIVYCLIFHSLLFIFFHRFTASGYPVGFLKLFVTKESEIILYHDHSVRLSILHILIT